MTFARWSAVLAIVIISSLLAGCGGGNSTDYAPSSSVPQGKRATWEDLNSGTSILRIQMDSGLTLICVEDSYADDDQSLSISCNWPDYNQRVRNSHA